MPSQKLHTNKNSQSKGRIAFLHPDLGLGGAERLIVDAAVGLKQKGYDVTIYAGYHNKKHAFPETTDGTIQVVRVGQWIPRSCFGRLVALCAYLKMAVVALYLTFLSLKKKYRPQVVVCDQVSACIPFLKVLPFVTNPKVMFYCHFPDQLLATRESFLKRLYRGPIDYCEEFTTGLADKIVVNSEFTKEVFKETFQRIRIIPDVLYPSINSKLFDDVMKSKQNVKLDHPYAKHLFVSINRFEPKKNIALAIRSLRKLRTCLTENEWNNVHLVLAGGYDPRLESSVLYLEKLKKVVAEEGVVDHVSFMLSPKDAVKVKLLASCSALVYTPSNEHFGIVPLEAMYMGKPVIAVHSGGPRETVCDGETGFLCPSIDSHFAVAMARIVKEPTLAEKMGKTGKQRFITNFSFDAFALKWEGYIKELINDSDLTSHEHAD